MDNGKTSWTLIRSAARGDLGAKSDFARLYMPVVRAYLSARWRGTTLTHELDDASQEVFLECFKTNGVLASAEEELGSGFRGFLYGVVCKVALRFRRSAAQKYAHQPTRAFFLDTLAKNEEPAAAALDRAWAQAIVDDTARLHEKRAGEEDEEFAARWKILREQIDTDRSLREIAESRDQEPATVYRANAKARLDYRDCLREVVRFHTGQPDDKIDDACKQLIDLL